MAGRIRDHDWSKTPLGPMETWSPSLRMMVRFLLANRFPLLLWWGPRFCQIYNDPYRPVLGSKHPGSLGQPAAECWSEIWDIIGPLIETPFQGGPPTWMEDIALEPNRHGFVEETHFTIAYSPVPDDTVESGIGGVLATVHEITAKVVGERRVVALRDVGARATDAKTAEEACEVAAEALARHPKDVPFALLYLVDESRKRARLAATCGVVMGDAAAPLTIELEGGESPAVWPLADTIQPFHCTIRRFRSRTISPASRASRTECRVCRASSIMGQAGDSPATRPMYSVRRAFKAAMDGMSSSMAM